MIYIYICNTDWGHEDVSRDERRHVSDTVYNISIDIDMFLDVFIYIHIICIDVDMFNMYVHIYNRFDI